MQKVIGHIDVKDTPPCLLDETYNRGRDICPTKGPEVPLGIYSLYNLG